MSMKINQLEIENVKRIKAVKIEPTANGLTIIGGRNNQGKTSVLDSIAWVLGGDKYRPSQAQRDQSVVPPNLRITMSNGLVVERKGKNSALKVTDPKGQKGGQQLLNDFVEQFSLNLPKFMESTSKEKAQILLKIIGVGDKLLTLEREEQERYNERLTIGRIADQKEKYAKEQPAYNDAPAELVSASELIKKQQDILAQNGENQRKRERLHQLEQEDQRLMEQIQELLKKQEAVRADLTIARMNAKDLEDKSTTELEQNISDIEEINRKVRANLDKEKAEDDAKEYRRQCDQLTKQLDESREAKNNLLKTAELPLPELSIKDGELIYKGQQWDNMSGSDRLKVATAIVRKLNPECGFVLLDKLEQMDLEVLNEFGEWLQAEGLQAIATRVSTGEECSIIIEDGYVAGQKHPLMEDKKTEWKEGVF
ncbi:AAA family ATPase [Lacrimispora sp.]|uniref:AAA family ATPase n=1 Tax=Lacrimispora sp. TaxID=2719234 RepID=UPI0028A97D7D|nr:AAA family ATPase [Lacrimispora sp.]